MLGARLEVGVDLQVVVLSIEHRALDLLGVSADPLAPLVEDRVLLRVRLGRTEAVPHRGVLGDEPQRHLLAAAADQDRQRRSDGRRVELREARLDPRQRRLERLQTPDRRAELVPVLVVVTLEPARPDPQDQPAVAQVVDRARHVGEQLGVPVGVAGDHRPELGVLGVARHRGEHRPPLEVRAVGLPVQREEVIPGPDRVDAQGVGLAPTGAEHVHRRVLRVELRADLEACHRDPSSRVAGTVARGTARRRGLADLPRG